MLSFRHPTTIIIVGPTQADKTFFFKEILEHQLIQPWASRIVFVYGDHSPDLNEVKHLYPSVEFVQGMKNLLQILSTIEPTERNLVVLDDQMAEAGKMEEMSNLFSKGSHQRNITIVYIVPNVFEKG